MYGHTSEIYQVKILQVRRYRYEFFFGDGDYVNETGFLEKYLFF